MNNNQTVDQRKMEHHSKNLEKTKGLKIDYFQTKFFQILSLVMISYNHDRDKNFY